MNGRKRDLSRREFLTSSAAVFCAAAIGQPGAGPARGRPADPPKSKVALVGTGDRGTSVWGKDLIERYGDILDLVGLCDSNPIRLETGKRLIGTACPTFTDGARMIRETRPDILIVAPTDSVHAKYIRLAMEHGCRPISEKPMCTDETMVQDILDTERRTGTKLTVTFNLRYSPDALKVKEILANGEIGEVLSVDFHWYLDVVHGASYFRRWHALKQFSGSLLVHKASHHFDLMNWWLGAEPLEVSAFGDLRKYGFNGPFRGERCRDCPHRSRCEFFWDITADERAMDLYVRAEPADGYIRDACVFRREVNIWDTMSVQVRYHSRALMTYSLNAFMPYEGYAAGFNGTLGRLDVRAYHAQPWASENLADFRLTRNFQKSRSFALGVSGREHRGADSAMQDDLFRATREDSWGRRAGSREGALSALIGIAARRSIEWGRPVKIDELVRL
jgi:predicted dehydrogenase